MTVDEKKAWLKESCRFKDCCDCEVQKLGLQKKFHCGDGRWFDEFSDDEISEVYDAVRPEDTDAVEAKIIHGANGEYWMGCGHCGRKFWKYISDYRISEVRVQAMGGAEIEIKCPSCKRMNRTKI